MSNTPARSVPLVNTVANGHLAEPSGVVDSRLFELYIQLRDFEARNDWLKSSIQLPKLCVCGAQSSGKSSLLQQYLGFPCAFVSSAVGTRCPVSYVLRYNAHCQEPRLTRLKGYEMEVQSDELSRIGIVGLSHWLHEQMEEVNSKEPTNFTDRELKVEVESKTYVNLELVDLPGFVDGCTSPVLAADGTSLFAEDGKTRLTPPLRVRQIVRQYVSDPNFIVVFLRRAEEDVNNDTGFTAMQDFFHGRLDSDQGSDHFICVATKFRQFKSRGKDANNLFAELKKRHPRIFFTELVPYEDCSTKREFNETSATWNQKKDFIMRVPALEKSEVANWKCSTFRDVEEMKVFENSGFEKLIGIEVILEEIRRTWTKLFTLHLLKIEKNLNDAMILAHAQINQWKERTADLDESAIRSSYLRYIERFGAVLFKYLDAEEAKMMDPAIYGQKWSDEQTLDIQELKLTEADEFKTKAMTWKPAAKTLDRVITTDENEKSFYHWFECNYTGSSEIERIGHVATFLALGFKPKTFDWAYIKNAMASLRHSSQLSLIEAARNMVCIQVDDCFDGSTEWFALKYLNLYYKFAKDVQKRLRSEFPELELQEKFHIRVRQAHLKSVIHHVRVAQELFKQTLNYRCKYLNLEESTRMAQILATTRDCRTHYFPYLETKIGGGVTLNNFQGPTVRQLLQVLPVPSACDLIVMANQIHISDGSDNNITTTVTKLVDEHYALHTFQLVADLCKIFNCYVYIEPKNEPTTLPFRQLVCDIEKMTDNELHELAFTPEKAHLKQQAISETVSLMDKISRVQECLRLINNFRQQQ